MSMLNVENTPLFGLVLSGGESTRMNQDKGSLNYHGITQTEYEYQLLKQVCSEVYVSCKKEQAHANHLKQFPHIHDRYLGHGPLGAILSDMSYHRQAAWIVLACDIPKISLNVVETLIADRDEKMMATVFYNQDEKRFEPLAALYETHSFHPLFNLMADGKSCPKKLFYNFPIKKININNGDAIEQCLMNANTPDDLNAIKKELNLGFKNEF